MKTIPPPSLGRRVRDGQPALGTAVVAFDFRQRGRISVTRLAFTTAGGWRSTPRRGSRAV